MDDFAAFGRLTDTLELFGRELPALRNLWQDDIRPRLSRTTIRTLARLRVEQFGTVTDIHRSAVRIPQHRTLTPGRLQAACAYGLEAIFGPDRP